MTAQGIMSAVSAAVNSKLTSLGKSITDTLTATENTQVTDAAAGALGTVNPNNDYPPVVKS